MLGSVLVVLHEASRVVLHDASGTGGRESCGPAPAAAARGIVYEQCLCMPPFCTDHCCTTPSSSCCWLVS